MAQGKARIARDIGTTEMKTLIENIISHPPAADTLERASFVNEISTAPAPVQKAASRPHIINRRAARWARRASH